MSPKEEAYKEVENLVNRFEEQLLSYKKSDYNETLVRRDFIDPFFKALGWDVDNSQGYAEAYREVIHEDRIKVSTATKAPDYSFRLPGGKRLFFVEAKKPSVYIKEDVLPAYQVRRYGWSAKLAVSIVTDFEEFALYDCIKKPAQTDKASTARIKYFTYKDYLNQFDFLWDTFSKERVLRGGLDRFVVSDKLKKGTATVDREFLNSLDEWRKELALNIALRNDVNNDELNFVVQALLDRLIFLRIAEDRNIEPYGALKNCIVSMGGEKNIAYTRLLKLFTEADSKYNSGIFNFKQDRISKKLEIDNNALRKIIQQLYYPESPYEFSVINVEILGSAYEQFLGKQIFLKGTHKATIEEKPEVRKAGGVYYTPQYIVDYIVDNTIGKLIENKTPIEVAKLKIVDPACGSGSFLLGAYDKLLKWHHAYYEPEYKRLSEVAGSNEYVLKDRNEAVKQRNKLPLTPEGRLTTTIKKQILLNNLHGVDIDANAVEVTKLSLLLKCLEDETQSSINAELRFGETVLPSLENNIRTGNSLIGVDFYEQYPDADTHAVKPFSWNDSFKEVFKQGGFDVVIGNPPYGASFTKEQIQYFSDKYSQTKKFPDSYCTFIIKGKELLKSNGRIGLIVPNTFCDLESCNEFREWFLTQNKLVEIYQTGWAFKDAIVDTLVFLAKNETSDINDMVNITFDGVIYSRKASDFYNNYLHKIDYRNNEDDVKLLKKFEQFKPLSDFGLIKAGVKMYEKGKGIPMQTDKILKERPYSKLTEQPKGWLPLYRGDDIKRYILNKPKEYVNYGTWLAAPRSKELFDSPKILMRRTDDKLKSNIDWTNAICVNSCHVIKINADKSEIINYKYLLALLNSKLIQRVFELQNPQMVDKVFSEIKVIYVERLPIKQINQENKDELRLHNEIVKLADSMLQLNQQLQQTMLPQQQELLKQRIAFTDKKIDALVYELYGLSEEEVKIVEGTL